MTTLQPLSIALNFKLLSEANQLDHNLILTALMILTQASCLQLIIKEFLLIQMQNCSNYKQPKRELELFLQNKKTLALQK